MNGFVLRVLRFVAVPLLIVVLGGLRAYGADERRTTFQMLVRTAAFDQEFEVRITEDPRDSMMGELKIKCVAKCPGQAKEYREEVSDRPLGGFLLGDGGTQFFTIWIGGSYYQLRAYDLEPKHITKVFDEASKSPPVIGSSAAGQPLIIVENYSLVDPPRHGARVHGSVWQWDGRRYKELP